MIKLVAYFVSLAALAMSSGGVAALTINSPGDVVQCEPVQFTWTSGQPPYYLSLLPPSSGGSAIKQFPVQNGTSFTWSTDLAAGTQFVISLRDSTGQEAESSTITVDSGPNSGCINTAVVDSGSGGMATATSAGPGANVAATGSGSNSFSPIMTSNSGATTVRMTTTAKSMATQTNAAEELPALQGVLPGTVSLYWLAGILGIALF